MAGNTKKAVSAPMCRIIANGTTEIGWGSGINVMESTLNVPVKVLGSVYVQQLCPVEVAVQASLSTIHIDGDTLESMGIYSQGDTKTIVNFPEVLLELVNTLNDVKPIARVYGCMPAGRSLPLGRGGIIARDIRFDCIRLEIVKEASGS